jgi:hypothetical protein
MPQLAKILTSLTLVGLLSACSTELSPDLQANIEKNKAGPAETAKTTGGDYQVSVAGQGKIALVVPMGNASMTLADIEAAAKAKTGCNAKALLNLYDMTGGNRNIALPRGVIGQFGGAIPVTLTC